MTIYDIYDGYEMSQTYSNMGIKFKVSISVFLSKKHFRNFYTGEKKNGNYR